MMESDKIMREQISMLADAELEEGDANRALLDLREPAQQATWALYHQIGDAIRCEHMAAPLSADFSARMAARLDAEPALLAPRSKKLNPAAVMLRRLSHSSGAWAAVAAAALAFVLAPHMLPTQQQTQHQTQLVHAPSLLTASPPAAILAEASQLSKSGAPVHASAGMDDYILVHQNSYPSLYGSAQLARPANLSEEPAR